MKSRNHKRGKNVRRSIRKDNSGLSDAQTIFFWLQINTATSAMTAKATGVPHRSICRYKRDYENKGLLKETHKAPCKITGRRAWYLTTNPDLFTKKNSGNGAN